MTNEQLKEGKAIKRQICSEEYHLRNLEFDVETGGRRGLYLYQGPCSHSDERAADMANIERVKARIAALKKKFATL
jgi:hypothetical protein